MLNTDIDSNLQINKFQNHHIKDLYVSEVHGDGSCMIHSALYLYNQKYREMSDHEKQTTGRRFRINIADVVLDAVNNKRKSKKLKSYRTFFENAIPTLPNEDLESYLQNVLKNPDEWLDETIIAFLEIFFQVNIVIFMDETYFIRGNVYDKNRDIMMFHYIKDTHYEPIFFKKNKETVYIVNNDDHEALHDKIMRTYLKTFRKSPTTSPLDRKEGPRETATLSESEVSQESVEDVDVPHVEKSRRMSSHDFDPTSSTSVDYYENFVMEDDIIFEEINDLDELVFTRIDKTIPIVYSREQTTNQINALYSFLKKGVKSSVNRNFTKLLEFKGEDAQSRVIFHNMTPLISASKQFMDENIETTGDETKNTEEYLSERNLFTKQEYKSYASKLEAHNRLLFPSRFVKDGKQEGKLQNVVRVCPELFESMMNATVFDRASVCERYIYTTKSRNKIVQQQIQKDNKHRETMINSQNYLEMYRMNVDEYPLHGFLLSRTTLRRHTKFSDMSFDIFNVTSYYRKLVSIAEEDYVMVSFLTGEEIRGTVVKINKEVIHIQLEKEFRWNDKVLNKVFFYTNRTMLSNNWFSLNVIQDGIVQDPFKKSTIFKKDCLYLFEPSDVEVFERLLLPTIDEYFIIKGRQWNSLKECFHDLKSHFDISLEDIKNEWIFPERGTSIKNEIISFEPDSKKPSYSNAKLLRFPKSSVYYPGLYDNHFKRNDTLLNRMTFKYQSFDHGLMKLNDYVIHVANQMDEDEEKTIQQIALYKKELDNTVFTSGLVEQHFYDNVEELFEKKDALRDNRKHKELQTTIHYLQEVRDYVKGKERVLSRLNAKRASNKSYYLTSIKPQDYMNISFLKSFASVAKGSEYLGSANIFDFEEVFNNMEKNRDLNFESLGASYEVEDETVTISSSKSIEQTIHYITLEFGGFKMEQYIIDYISENLVHFVAQMFEERKALFKRKNPNVKDLSKMFKSQSDKNKYVEYANITMIASFLLIFISINKASIEVYKPNKKCSEFFKIQGFPLPNGSRKEKTDAKDPKNTLTYLSCLISNLFANNPNLSNAERNEKKLMQTTTSVLKEKLELVTKLNQVKHDKTGPSLVETESFIAIDKTSTKTDLLMLGETLSANKTIFDMRKSAYKRRNTLMIQLKKSLREDESTLVDTSSETIRFDTHTAQEKIAFVEEMTPDFLEMDANDTSSSLFEKMDALSFRFETNYQVVKDVYISFKNQDLSRMVLFNEGLYRYARNYLLIQVSKIIHKFNNMVHFEKMIIYGDKMADPLFAKESAQKAYDKESVELTVLNRISNSEELYSEITRIATPSFDRVDVNMDGDKIMKCTLSYMRTILEYIDAISNVDLNNQDIQFVAKRMMDGILESIQSVLVLEKDYKNDVENMREEDKQTKYNQKDKMGDDERLLYLMLEKVGIVPEMDEFKKIYEEEVPSAFSPSSPLAENENNNPEYEAFVGENDDELD